MIKTITLHHDKVSMEIEVEVPKDSALWEPTVSRKEQFERLEGCIKKAIDGFLKREGKRAG